VAAAWQAYFTEIHVLQALHQIKEIHISFPFEALAKSSVEPLAA
jgi:hypothetical protein